MHCCCLGCARVVRFLWQKDRWRGVDVSATGHVPKASQLWLAVQCCCGAQGVGGECAHPCGSLAGCECRQAAWLGHTLCIAPWLWPPKWFGLCDQPTTCVLWVGQCSWGVCQTGHGMALQPCEAADACVHGCASAAYRISHNVCCLDGTITAVYV